MMTDPRTALVTGATGFIGRHLARRLIGDGWAVKALVRGDRSPRYLAEAVGVVVGDLTRPSSLKGAVTGCDVVFHTACATAGTFAADRDAEMLFMRVNRDGTEAIGREAAAAGARFVHLSSTAAMGLGQGAGPVDEETTENPTSPYGRSKLQAEHALRKLRDGDGLDAVVLRPCMTAGPGKRGGEIRKLVKMAGLGVIPVIQGSEDAIKPILYVDDLVDAMLLAFEKGTSGRTYLIHDGARHTLMQIVEAAGRVAGKQRPYIRLPAPAMRWAATTFDAIHQRIPRFNPPVSVARLEMLEASREISVERARRELGYAPGWTNVEEMLRLSV